MICSQALLSKDSSKTDLILPSSLECNLDTILYPCLFFLLCFPQHFCVIDPLFLFSPWFLSDNRFIRNLLFCLGVVINMSICKFIFIFLLMNHWTFKSQESFFLLILKFLSFKFFIFLILSPYGNWIFYTLDFFILFSMQLLGFQFVYFFTFHFR